MLGPRRKVLVLVGNVRTTSEGANCGFGGEARGGCLESGNLIFVDYVAESVRPNADQRYLNYLSVVNLPSL